MGKRFIGLAAALIAAAALWPIEADARQGGGGGGGMRSGGGMGFSGGAMRGGFSGGGMRSFSGGGVRSFSGGGMRSFNSGGMRSFSGVRSGPMGGPMVRSGARFATGPAFHRGFGGRGHHFRHHRRFFPAAAFIGAPLAYGAYSYYYDDDCYAWVEDWRYPTGWRRVYVCY